MYNSQNANNLIVQKKQFFDPEGGLSDDEFIQEQLKSYNKARLT